MIPGTYDSHINGGHESRLETCTSYLPLVHGTTGPNFRLTFTMSSIEGVAVKSALWASITTSITRGMSTNCKQATEESGHNATKTTGFIYQAYYSTRIKKLDKSAALSSWRSENLKIQPWLPACACVEINVAFLLSSCTRLFEG